jgi:hypothetical protein
MCIYANEKQLYFPILQNKNMGIYGYCINVQMSKCAYMQMKNNLILRIFKTKTWVFMGVFKNTKSAFSFMLQASGSTTHGYLWVFFDVEFRMFNIEFIILIPDSCILILTPHMGIFLFRMSDVQCRI